MTINEKIYKVIEEYINKHGIGDIKTDKEIRSIIDDKYKIKKSSLQLTDYCYNNYNDGIKDKFVNKSGLFLQKIDMLEGTVYKILGSNYLYSGEVYHTPKGSKETYVVGKWENGIFSLMSDKQIKDRKAFAEESEKLVQKIENEINNIEVDGDERNQIVKIRVNQGVFRNQLLKRYKHCCLCGVTNLGLLVASHIKPWAISKSKEKLDVNNGLLLCPNHDRLFDKGYISFDNDGNILISEELNDDDKIFTNVHNNMKIVLMEESKEYMKYHREKIFHL